MNTDEIEVFLSKRNYRHVATRRQKIKEKLVEYKGGKCEICGYNKCITALEFHHIDPNKKDFTISSSKVLSFEKCKNEVDNCMLVCANCHREIHYNDFVLKRKVEEDKEKQLFFEAIKNREKYNIKYVRNSISYLEELGIMEDIKNNVSKTKIREKYHIDYKVLKDFLKSKGITYREAKSGLTKPSKEELIDLLKKHSKSAIGRLFGVSCNAVIKWCRKYGI